MRDSIRSKSTTCKLTASRKDYTNSKLALERASRYFVTIKNFPRSADKGTEDLGTTLGLPITYFMSIVKLCHVSKPHY